MNEPLLAPGRPGAPCAILGNGSQEGSMLLTLPETLPWASPLADVAPGVQLISRTLPGPPGSAGISLQGSFSDSDVDAMPDDPVALKRAIRDLQFRHSLACALMVGHESYGDLFGDV